MGVDESPENSMGIRMRRGEQLGVEETSKMIVNRKGEFSIKDTGDSKKRSSESCRDDVHVLDKSQGKSAKELQNKSGPCPLIGATVIGRPENDFQVKDSNLMGLASRGWA
ncbi:hypothetical protein L6452_36871 [Arctium lappa]|uniref:Uncharacterized protein n=1 Tax=Arctium lappa TaxID=4217 RepID=A0ACB8Y1H4_ARCLA|nr:hypothetical protein L6452_36871 [Arctium lappa]